MDGKVFFPSLFEALKEVEDAETYREAMDAVMNYAFYSEEPSGLSPVAKMVFVLVRPSIDAGNAKQRAGKLGAESRWAARKGSQNADSETPQQEEYEPEEETQEDDRQEATIMDSDSCEQSEDFDIVQDDSLPLSATSASDSNDSLPSSAIMAKNSKNGLPSSAIAESDSTKTNTKTKTRTKTRTETKTKTRAKTRTETGAAHSARSRTHAHGPFGHVLLSESAYAELTGRHGVEDTEAAIKAVDEYCESTGKVYPNYSVALERWGYDAVKERKLARSKRASVGAANAGSTGGFDARAYLLKKIEQGECHG